VNAKGAKSCDFEQDQFRIHPKIKVVLFICKGVQKTIIGFNLIFRHIFHSLMLVMFPKLTCNIQIYFIVEYVQVIFIFISFHN
jgi:hypothetical protein